MLKRLHCPHVACVDACASGPVPRTRIGDVHSPAQMGDGDCAAVCQTQVARPQRTQMHPP
eukprot:CAMPEP_0171098626 /NCGR_PEP_ID=MMETSP0766_2-20121228/48912_1 /TAXON_ID=439317 /ORGANISM="Gambierdiscus australes, Strain CAWD 149" /LENGTH=59 /DNA_ID=CAMNT_0011558019 /DNA_START=115 /DNA_END=290 /DNA_ORIENTATION=+